MMSQQHQQHSVHNSDGVTATSSDTPTNAEAIEKLWAKERYEMSYGDREASSYELHGVVSRAIVETPELISNALQEFDNELKKLAIYSSNNSQSSSCSSCSSSSPHHANNTYIQSSTFRLRFLRSELFDIKKSVKRYCICIDLLVEYFGDYALQRQLFLSDLNKEEMKILKDGTLQILPSRDTLGRRIMVFIGNCGGDPQQSWKQQSLNKVGLFLIFQILAEDITTQRNGIVSIHIIHDGMDIHARMNSSENGGPEQYRQFLTKVLYGAPCRWSGLHICFQSSSSNDNDNNSNNYNSSSSNSNNGDGFIMRNIIRPLFLFIIGKPGRKVLRIHSGSSIECEYSLKSFGIQVDDIPLTHTGTVKLINHSRWIKVRSIMDKFIKEQASSVANANDNSNNYQYYYSIENTIIPFPKIQCPEVHCVLFRKNGVAWEHPGNIKFRAFLQELDNRIAESIKQSEQTLSEMQSDTAQQSRSKTITTENLYTDSDTNTDTATTMAMAMSLGMSTDEHIGYILQEAILHGFSFLMYDEKNHWYIELKEEDELRKQLRSALRGHRKRRTRVQTYNNTDNMLFMQIQIGNKNSNNNINDDIHDDNNSNSNNNTTMMDIDTTTKTSNNYSSNSVSHQYNNSNSNSNSNSNMMDFDMIEPNLVVFTNMDGKRRRTKCCRIP